MGWPELRDAVQAAIVTASGLAAGRVLWSFQDTDQPPLDYIALHLGASITVGYPFIESSTDMNRPAGTEIKQAVVATEEVPLELQCFTGATVASNPRSTSDDAIGRLRVVKASLFLPSLRASLASVGVVPFDCGPVQYAPAVVSAGFRGRATMTVRCYMPSEAVAEYVGIIRTAQGTITVSSVDLPFSTP